MRSILIFIFFSLFYNANLLYAQIITTVAGGATGHGGIWGIGGLATNAELSLFGGLAVDDNGNIYIAPGNNEILKVDVMTDIISIVAGTGVAGYNGDGIAATNAQLNNPGLVWVDHQGNFYIGDGDNNRIRKVNITTGIITTFAGNGVLGFSGDGGPATAADADFEASSFDIFGNMIVETSRDHRIRKINTLGVILTIAGTGITGNSGDGGPASAATMAPNGDGICTDRYGNIYFSDSFLSVRKINVSTGIITRVAGTGDHVGYPYSGDGGPATDAHTSPLAVSVDDTGNLYIVDGANSRIEKIDTFGIIHSIAGIGTHGYGGDGGPATAGELNYPENVCLDICGNVYIADFNNARVRKITYNPTCSDSVQYSLNAATITPNTAISLYPNPATTTLTITAPTQISKITINNLTGQTIYEQTYQAEKAGINVAALPAGMYIVAVTDDEGNKVVRRFIKE